MTSNSKTKNQDSDYEDFPTYHDYDEHDEENDNHNNEAQSQNSNIDEFYDAISQISFNLSNTSETLSTNSYNIAKTKSLRNKQRYSKLKQHKRDDSDATKRNMDFSVDNDSLKTSHILTSTSPVSTTTFNSINDSSSSSSSSNLHNSELLNSIKEASHSSKLFSKNQSSINSKKSNNSSKIDTLVLVVHGGNITCTDTSKKSDFLNFKSTMDTVMKSQYQHLYGSIAYRLIVCESICKEALMKLAALSPVANEQNLSWNDSDDLAETSAEVFALHENLPFSTLPLLAIANQEQYRLSLSKFTRECNKVYQEFLNSDEGQMFQGQVVIVGDSVGSILVYDALCQSNNNNMNGDESYHASSTGSSQLNIQQSITTPQSPISPISAKSMNIPTVHSSGNSPNAKRKDFPSINISDTTRNNETSNINNNANNIALRRNGSTLSSSSGIEFSASPFLTPPTFSNLLIPPFLNSVSTYEERLDFDVTHFFVFGSPLGLILAYRKIANDNNDVPCCAQIYNLFHVTDPVATRIEPILCKQFKFIQPCMIPRYSKFPLGDGSNLSLDHFIVKYGSLFDTNNLVINNNNNSKMLDKNNSLGIINDSSTAYLTPNIDQLKSLQKIISTKKNWWGDNRIDYVLYAPENITNLPRKSLPYIFHSCFWESTDVVAFILRMIDKTEQLHSNILEKTVSKSAKEPIEKWEKRLNRVKLRNLSANHRANDVIVQEDREQILSAKFSYGPLDFALSGERVEVYIMPKSSNQVEWQFYASELTDSHGKLKYELPKDKRLPLGIYNVKMVVKCDKTSVEFYLAVLPANTEAVVFSIDGSFAANISFSGTDPKVRAGAVDVVRYWQDLGYLIIYVTARPDIQHYKVTNWLAQHNFPLGMVFFSDGLSRDPMRQKTEILRGLTVNNCIQLHAAYGSTKDIPMYSCLGVASTKIFIIGKTKSKYTNQAIILRDGYASHLNYLQNPNNGSRQASGNARLILKKFCFNTRHNQFAYSSNNGSNTTTPSGENESVLSHYHTFSYSTNQSFLKENSINEAIQAKQQQQTNNNNNNISSINNNSESHLNSANSKSKQKLSLFK